MACEIEISRQPALRIKDHFPQHGAALEPDMVHDAPVGKEPEQVGRPARKIGAVDANDDSLLRVRDRRGAAIDSVCLEPGKFARGDFKVRKNQPEWKPPEEPSDVAALSTCIACAKPSVAGQRKKAGLKAG